VQLHGDECPEYCSLVKYPVIKGVRVGAGFDPRSLEAYEVEWLLLDSFVSGQQGGTGVVFDWQQTKILRQQIKGPLFVAGGLTAENVGEAVRLLTPQGIDVSGGVETHGGKDSEKIEQFVKAVRKANGGEGYDIAENYREQTPGCGHC
jgi:phosphoribosylanthranilate isomerase